MPRFPQAVAFAIALLVCALATPALATEGESPVFAFDTRESYSTHFADSASFTLDTRSSNTTHHNESAVFAFDTRASDGLGGSGTSGTFVLDTRATPAEGLTIVGPVTVSTGTATEYRVAYRCGNTTTDVTAQSTLGFVGSAPTWAGIGGTTLFVNRNAPAGSVTLRAVRVHAGGQSLSTTMTVSVGQVLRAGMVASAQWTAGTTYTVTLNGTATGGLPPYTFRWDTDGNGTYGDKTGQNATAAIDMPNGGTRLMKLEVVDGIGSRAYAEGRVTMNRPPVVNEPVHLKPVGDVASGKVYNKDGGSFQFDTARIGNGVIIITHGLYGKALGSDSWMQDMASRLDTRLTANGNAPNIVLYDWSHASDPGGEIPAWKLKALGLLSHARTGLGLFNASKLGLDKVKKKAAEAIQDEALSIVSEELTGIPLDWSGAAILADTFIDAVAIRNIGETQGQILAAWIWNQANSGLIDPDQKIHLIGHSAGGFTVGACALWLRQHPLPNGKTVWVDRTTMLDTPFPIRPHMKTLPNPNYVERIISSHLGGLEFPTTWFIMPGAYLNISTLGSTFYLRITGAGHELAHRWYRRTILPQGESDGEELDSFAPAGFAASPFLGGPMVPRGSAPLAASGNSGAAAFSGEAPLAANGGGGVPVDGFTTFGGVAFQDDIYTLTEQANAGITKPLTMPVGAEALAFRFKFAAAGDGDFLEVRFGEDLPLYIGLDTVLSRDGFTEIEVPLDGLDGLTAALTFTLISRGVPNAVVQLSDIRLITSDDPDGDGLTTTQEATLGTNPLVADTDGDGISDGAEGSFGTSPLTADSDSDGLSDGAEVAGGTNPLDSASTFKVNEIVANADGTITVRWESQAGRTYRVIRSLKADFTEFDVIASNIVGLAPTTPFTDTAINAATTFSAFYRVQLE